MKRPSGALIALALASAFLLRLAFGVTSDFWGPDELQVYLIGLKFYTTGVWPTFGADVIYTETQIPGGLQGLLVGGPFWVLPWPEAPHLLLNVLSFAALTLLGWYITRRLPDVPRWFLWPSIFFSPWTLDVSTHVINTDYVVIGAVPFFVAAFELIPATRIGAVPRPFTYFGLGFGLLWVAQIHLSVVLLVPVAIAAVVLDVLADRRGAARAIGCGVAGALVAGLTLIPTWVLDGPRSVAGQVGANVSLEPGHLLRVPQIAAQFMSLASVELPRFIGASTDERFAFLARYPWASPFVVFAGVVGIIQVAVLLAGLLFRPAGRADWTAVRTVTLVVLGLVILAFAASVKAPASHAFYVVLPVALMYAFYWWTALLRHKAVRAAGIALIVSGGVAHVAIAARNFTDRSLYRNRELVVRAIEERNSRLIGDRRAFAKDGDR